MDLHFILLKIKKFIFKNMSTSFQSVEETTPKNIILLLEDDKRIIGSFDAYFTAKKMDAELIVSENLTMYLQNFDNYSDNVKCLVMDLNNQGDDMETSIGETIKQIKNHYENNRIPIFVHSGNLAHFTDLDEKGTIIKKEKTSKSIGEIVNSIELMLNCGFLNIFSINGTLDKKIMTEIHSAFINQFKHNEIEEIIKSIQNGESKEPDTIDRTKEVFERIAIRAIYQNLINNDIGEKGIIVNTIEHYYRRTNTDKHYFYTGDIFEDQDNKMFFVATPRCNVSNKNYEEILLCEVNEITDNQATSFQSTKVDNKTTGETKGSKQLRTSITDDVTNSFIGERFRFLPPSPQFKGGFVDFRKVITVTEDELNGFNLIISLVDDLTNDVVRKLSSYLLRGGISDTAYEEALYYIKNDSSEEQPKA